MRSAGIILALEVALLIGLFIGRGPIQRWHLQQLSGEVSQTIVTNPTNVERQLERLKEAASTYERKEIAAQARRLDWECWLFGIGNQAEKFDYLAHEYDNIRYWSDETFRKLLEANLEDFAENLNKDDNLKWHRIRLPETWGICLKHLQETAPALLKTIAEHPERYSTIDVGRLDGAMQTLQAPERLDVLRAFAKRNNWRATRALYDMLQKKPQEREAELKALAEGGNQWAHNLLGKSQAANSPVDLKSDDLEALTRHGLTEQGQTGRLYLERAAEAGWVPAYSALGQYYLSEKDFFLAGRWLRLAVANSEVEGYFPYALYRWETMPDNIDWGNRTRVDAAIKAYLLWAKKASDMGNAVASLDLGQKLLVGLYTNGEETLLKADPKVAKHCFQLSKAQGNTDAEAWLYCYENPPEAPFASNMTLQWTLGHARAGNAEAQYQIGVDRLANVDKVQKKAEMEEEAIKWLKRAVEQKHGNAAYRLWKFYEKKRDWQAASTYRDFAKQYNSKLYEEEMERTSQKSKPVSTPKKREQSNAEREMFNLLWSL